MLALFRTLSPQQLSPEQIRMMNEVGAAEPQPIEHGGRADVHCECEEQASMTPLGMGEMPTVHPGADAPPRLGIASSRVYLGDERARHEGVEIYNKTYIEEGRDVTYDTYQEQPHAAPLGPGSASSVSTSTPEHQQPDSSLSYVPGDDEDSGELDDGGGADGEESHALCSWLDDRMERGQKPFRRAQACSC